MMDMLKHIRIVKTPLISFCSVTLLGAAGFCASSFKPLGHSTGYALRGFHEYPQKPDTRRMDESGKFGPLRRFFLYRAV